MPFHASGGIDPELLGQTRSGLEEDVGVEKLEDDQDQRCPEQLFAEGPADPVLLDESLEGFQIRSYLGSR